MALDLSSIMPRAVEPWYELELEKLQGMPESTIEAHIHSMSHSQRHDYQKELRLVITTGLKTGANPLDPASYSLKGLQRALLVCPEVVIRQGSRDYVVKAKDGQQGVWRETANITTAPNNQNPIDAAQDVADRAGQGSGAYGARKTIDFGDL